ncbi:MAG: efflux transporter outer membrane subunit [Pseudomonadota bacterium]
MNSRNTLSVATAAIALSACATPPADLSAAAEPAQAYRDAIPTSWQGIEQGYSVPVDWVEAFNDPLLSALVSEALSNNTDLTQAMARRDRARAQLRASRSALFPSLSFDSLGREASGFEGGSSSALYQGSLTVSYEIDLWGRLRHARDGDLLSLEAAEADLDGARRLIAASVVEAYVAAIEAREQARVAENTFEQLDQTLRFIEAQFERGLRSGRDIALIRADVETSRSAIAAAKNAENDALRALETLVGRYPDLSTELSESLPVVPAAPGLGLPLDILAKRPDLVAAEARFRASLLRADAARTAQRPQFSLSAGINGSSATFDDILDPSSWASAVTGSLAGPIFDAGQRRANVDLADADVLEALSGYEALLRDAFLEVESALDEQDTLVEQDRAIGIALSEAEQAFRFTRFSYDNGEGDLLDVLSLQQRVASLESDAVRINRQRLEQYTALSLSLGGRPVTR